MGKDQELIEAARNGDYNVVEKLLNSRAKKGTFSSLRRGPGANAQDANGFSALHHAAVNRHKEIVELLLSHEASTNIVDLQGSSPLHLAAWSGNEEIVRLLLTQVPSVPGPGAGPNVNLMNRSSETPLHMASQFGHTEVVKLLLHHGADPVITNEKHETALDLAAQYGRLETVQLLLRSHPELLASYSAPVCPSSQQILFPHTPLHLASRNGHRAVVEVLMKAGFEANARTSQGTALHEAALCGKVDVVKALLDAGIDVCVADSQRRTAVDRLNEVGLRTPVAKEIADLIRNALKKKHIQQGKAGSPLCSPHESVPSNNKDGKLPLSQIYDNHSYSDVESKLLRYSPHHSPKANSFARGKTRRSMDVSMGKGPDFEKPIAPPKKPPRRNLSASPTHPGTPDFGGEHPELMLMGRNKSLDEGVYGDRWRKSLTAYETSQSSESIDLSPVEHHKSNSCAKSDITFFNGVDPDDLKCKSKSQHLGLDSQYVSVAHIKLRDAKSEQNVSQNTQDESSDDPEHISHEPHHQHNNPSTQKSNPPLNNNNGLRSNGKTTIIEVGVDSDLKKRTLPRGPKPAIAPKPNILPKPKNIKRQGYSCDNAVDENKVKYIAPRKTTPKSTSMSVLSPVDVDREWENITMFMDSFNGRIDGGENGEVKNMYGLSPVGKWLATIKMTEYEQLLLSSGFDDLQFLGDEILDENSLLEIGMLNAQHRKIVAASASKLEVSWPRSIRPDEMPDSVETWLKELHLDQCVETFRKNLYIDTDRLLRLCNDELITLLNIDLVGHRRRILVASSKIHKCYGGSNTHSTRFENGVGMEELDDDGSLPLRDPNHLVSGVSSALKTAWRHSPETLIDGSVTYKAIYVGSSQVQEFSTTDSIQTAIQEIRNKEMGNKPLGKHFSVPSEALLLNTQVTLIVSATVVSWYNAKTKSLVKEQDIRSIQCTCQASDDLRHLALVTRASDPNDKSHSCHVFCLDSVEVATEAILTLGQAFEVAYQLALVSRSHGRDNKGHMRSKSANQLSSKASCSPNSKLKRDKCFSNMTSSSHCRSQSVTDIPPVPILGISKSSSNSPQIDPHIKKVYRFPRAESFSFSSNSNLTRAPIVSKEEL